MDEAWTIKDENIQTNETLHHSQVRWHLTLHLFNTQCLTILNCPHYLFNTECLSWISKTSAKRNVTKASPYEIMVIQIVKATTKEGGKHEFRSKLNEQRLLKYRSNVTIWMFFILGRPSSSKWKQCHPTQYLNHHTTQLKLLSKEKMSLHKETKKRPNHTTSETEWAASAIMAVLPDT